MAREIADGCEDFGGSLAPDEGSGAPIVLGKLAFNCRRQIDDASERPASRAAPGARCEEAVERIKSGQQNQRSMKTSR